MLKSEQPSFAESFYCFFLEIVWPVIYNMYPKGANNKIWMDVCQFLVGTRQILIHCSDGPHHSRFATSIWTLFGFTRTIFE
jgi:hypothetical protein